MRQILADPTQNPDFRRKGYVKVPMLSAAEVAHLLDRLAELRPDDEFAGRFTTYHCSFLDSNADYKRQTFELVKSVFESHVERLLHGFRLLNANFYVKPPGTGEFTVHQNWPAISDLDDTTVTIWCPLGDVAESNGAIQVVEGSHKIVPHVETPNSSPYFQDFTQELIRDHLKPVEMTAGEALIFDDSLIHWSARNASDQPRVAIQALCIPVDATPAFFHKTEDSRFELIHADTEFFLTHDPPELYARQPQWQSLGFVEDRNRPVSLDDFTALLANGEQTRAGVYGSVGGGTDAGEPDRAAARGWRARLRSRG
jgi:hypothetical protein